MAHLSKWPLALAVSSSIMLTGCLGGGGGGSGSSSGGGNPGGGGGSDPAPTLTAYNLSIDTFDAVAALGEPTGNLQRLTAALVELLAPLAHAQVAAQPRPEDVRVVLMGGDDNGTPEDPSDDQDHYLEPETDYRVEQGEDGLVVLLPFTPRFDHYIEVALGASLSLSVPTYQTSLIADPITTFITRMLSSRAAQFDELTLAEVDELIEDIRQLSEEPAIRAAIAEAYATASDTQALLDAVGAELYALVDERLEERVTPPITPEGTASVAGEYYFQGMDVGAYQSYQSVGLLLGGVNNQVAIAPVSNSQARVSIAAGQDMQYEAVHDMFGYVGVRVSIGDEDEEELLGLDSRGLNVAEQEEVFPYDKEDTSAPRCQTLSAACMDREYDSAQRLLTAGPANARFNTLVSTAFSDRLVTNADNGVELKVLNGSVDIGVRKPAGVLPLTGEYGILEVDIEDVSNRLAMTLNLMDASFNGNSVRYCERLTRSLTKVMLPAFQVGYQASPNDDCSPDNEDRTGTFDAVFGDEGSLTVGDTDGALTGFASADGLTYLAYQQDPDIDDLVDEDLTVLEVPSGERITHFAVKRDLANTSLANKRYRLMSVGVGAAQYMLEMNRYITGTLEFDANGNATLQTAIQWQRLLADNTTQAQNNRQVTANFSGSNLAYADGRLRLTGITPIDGTDVALALNGYVQEGGRLLLLSREATTTTTGYRMIGAMVGVCLNCE